MVDVEAGRRELGWSRQHARSRRDRVPARAHARSRSPGRAVEIGRPIVWGLVVDGENGVRDVLNLLRDELDLAMALVGCRSIDEISLDLLRPE
jgi:FMN-dependent dehydrogenase